MSDDCNQVSIKRRFRSIFTEENVALDSFTGQLLPHFTHKLVIIVIHADMHLKGNSLWLCLGVVLEGEVKNVGQNIIWYFKV